MAATTEDDYGTAAAVAVFHESRAGVRGLVESGVNAIPPIFLLPTSPSPPTTTTTPAFAIPAVDLSLPRRETVAQVRAAACSCGFFHVTNHGVPAGLVDSAVSAARAFHEQPRAARSALYSIEPTVGGGAVTYSTIPIARGGGGPSSSPLPLLPWRDTLRVRFGPREPDLGRLPAACREALQEYQRSLTALGKEMAGLLSEALGVGTERLERAMQVEGWLMACHYYPPCPEPERVVGSLEHTDPSLFTVLAQDGLGGLQVRRHDGQWVDVAPLAGALLVNIGDLLKVVSNDELKSVEHRVVIKSTQDARVSIALFFNPGKRENSDRFGPLPDLATVEKPARYWSFTVPEFMSSRREYGHNRSSIDLFKSCPVGENYVVIKKQSSEV